jgi:hypothetical protein
LSHDDLRADARPRDAPLLYDRSMDVVAVAWFDFGCLCMSAGAVFNLWRYRHRPEKWQWPYPTGWRSKLPHLSGDASKRLYWIFAIGAPLVAVAVSLDAATN